MDHKYSTFAPRFWTGFVDSCVLWPISFISSVAFSFTLPKFLAALFVIIEGVPWLLYTVALHARYGQTVGKMVTKVKVVDFKTEQNIGYKQACLRECVPLVLNVVGMSWQIFVIFTRDLTPAAFAQSKEFEDVPLWLLAGLPACWFLAELLTMLTNEKRRALHDLIAGTVVVRTNVSPYH